ncbi:MAG: SLC13 family permease [bacterium]
MNRLWSARSNAKPRWVLFLIASFAVVWFFWPSDAAQGAKDKPKGKTGAVVTAPRYVAVQGVKKLREFVAGKKGELELVLYLAAAKDAQGNALSWDPRGRGTLQIRARSDSGITFGKNSNAAAVPVDVSRSSQGRVSVKVPYSVSSRVRVRNYKLRIQVSVPLRAADGARIQDAGALSLPARVDTPLRTKIIVVAILLFAVFLFIVEWVRVDVVAILMMVSLPLLNLLSSKLTFTGLSSNAVIAIIGVMIVSAGLNKVGLVSRAVAPVIKAAGSSSTKLMVFLSSLIALISSVMQNTGAAVLFLPGIRNACKVMKIPISKVLMPIGMCAILGGTITMIGTSPLILLNDILPEGVSKFSLLELTPIGVAFVLSGVLYFSTVGSKFLKQITEAQSAREGQTQAAVDEGGDTRTYYHDLEGPFELVVPTDWEPRAGVESLTAIRKQYWVSVVSTAHPGEPSELAPPPSSHIRAGQHLCVYGPTELVDDFVREFGLVRLEKPQRFRELFNPAVAGTVEALVSPRSSLIGRTIREVGFRSSFGVSTLALYREGRTYYEQKSDIPLLPGDAVLIHSTWEHLETLGHAHHNFKIITPLEAEIQKPSKAGSAVACFLLAMTLMLVSSFYFQKLPYNPIPLGVCLMIGAVGMVVTGVLPIHAAYEAVDWRTVFLLGGLIPLGMAVDRTGTAEWIARGVVSALGDSVTPLLLIAVLACLSGMFCLVISNVGACTLLVPLGASMATQIGVDPRVAAIVVGLGVSNSFLLPTHQVNALYMGPGGYRTKDYMKIGGIMSLIYIIVLVSMTYFFYL